MEDYQNFFNDFRRWKTRAAWLCVVSVSAGAEAAPASGSESMEVIAKVLVPLELEVVDGVLDFGIINPGQALAKVDPVAGGDQAAAFRITGSVAYPVHIHYSAEVLLGVVGDAAAPKLSMIPLLSGSGTNNQTHSTAFFGQPVSKALSASGEFFLWFGGQIDDLSTLQMGDYEGDFIITVEYDL